MVLMGDIVNVCIIAELDVFEVRVIIEEDLGVRKTACNKSGNYPRTHGDSLSDGHSSEVYLCLLIGAILVGFSKNYRARCKTTQIIFRCCGANYGNKTAKQAWESVEELNPAGIVKAKLVLKNLVELQEPKRRDSSGYRSCQHSKARPCDHIASCAHHYTSSQR